MKTDSEPRSILVIRTSALGDVAMTVPVVCSLARQYPERRVLMLTQAPFDQLFRGCPPNVVCVIADWKGRHSGPMGLARLVRELSRKGISAVADLHNVPRSWAIGAYFRLRGIPVAMVNKGRRKRKALTRLKHKDVRPQKSYLLRYTDVMERLGMPVSQPLASPWPAAHASRPQPFPRIGIAPFARYATKTYPAELMEKVVEALAAQGCQVFLFGGGKTEREILEQWEARHAGCTSVAGKLPLDEELSLMGRLDVMVSMDSANMHLASLAGVPVVSVWGSTTPQCGFLGWGQKEDCAVCLHLPCQPCSIGGREKCPLGHFACMKSISPDAIVRQVTRILSAGA